VGKRKGRSPNLDTTTPQTDPRYVRTLALYQKVLLQRNTLLRAIPDGRARVDQLGYWHEELTDASAFVVLRRSETVAAMDRLAHEVHRSLTGMRERLELRYAPNPPLDG